MHVNIEQYMLYTVTIYVCMYVCIYVYRDLRRFKQTAFCRSLRFMTFSADRLRFELLVIRMRIYIFMKIEYHFCNVIVII